MDNWQFCMLMGTLWLLIAQGDKDSAIIRRLSFLMAVSFFAIAALQPWKWL